jgi:hypothetical protein
MRATKYLRTIRNRQKKIYGKMTRQMISRASIDRVTVVISHCDHILHLFDWNYQHNDLRRLRHVWTLRPTTSILGTVVLQMPSNNFANDAFSTKTASGGNGGGVYSLEINMRRVNQWIISARIDGMVWQNGTVCANTYWQKYLHSNTHRPFHIRIFKCELI